MIRLARALALAAALTLLAAPSAAGYAHLSETVGSQVLPKHWRTSAFPINLTIDGNSSVAFQNEIQTAVNTWNAEPLTLDPWGATPTVAADDFTKDNYLTKWGDLGGDGKQEVVVDGDGSILSDFGLVPASINGFGESGGIIRNGEAEIQDMYLLINGSRTNFDRQATAVHELGHTLGLAHSTVGFAIDKDGALLPELEAEVPTMHPFGISTNDRQSLEADDVASLGELYPAPLFATSTGTITGTVTRCGSGDPVLGANVRAINKDDRTIQLTQVTGIDGATDGSYTIHGVPPGEYDVVVEPLSGDDDYMSKLGYTTRIDTDFTAEFLDDHEDDCTQDTDPTVKNEIPVGATGIKTADFKVEGATLAFVIDETASMGPEIGGVKQGLEAMITNLQTLGGTFPKTTIVTFDDQSQLRVTTRDPNRLLTIIDNLHPHSTSDCPEGSNRALMTAARQLGAGGRAILATDADSLRSGPSRQTVEDFYRSKGLRLTTLLSGSCPVNQNPPARAAFSALAAETPPPVPGAGPDEARPVDALGVENAVRTFSEESLLSGGAFTFQPEIKSATAEAQTRYSNTLANIAISAVRPAIATVNPGAVPQGSGLDVELSGSNTGFRAGSTVTVSGSDVAVSAIQILSPTRITVHLAAAPSAATGFRDVTVSTPRGDGTTETATGLGAVEVVGPPAGPTILSVTPSLGAVGTTEDVAISGGATSFNSGSGATFGAGVTVNHLTVNSHTSAVANITISPGAAIGFRDASVGGAAPARFLVGPPTPPIARLTSAAPAAGTRGTTVDVALTGADTAFAAGTSVASVSGTGVDVLSTTVQSPTAATARLRIAPDAPLGFRDLKVTTGVEDAALLDGFEVRPVAAQQGGGGAGPTTCSDTARPQASFLKGKKGAGAKKRKLSLHGRASDAGCVAQIAVAGKVARVEVAISRKAGKKCRFVAANGKLGKARGCSKPVFLKAKGTTTWSLSLKRKLPRGSYTVLVRARDAAGNLQGKAAKRTVRIS
jgi:hypothetical protein